MYNRYIENEYRDGTIDAINRKTVLEARKGGKDAMWEAELGRRVLPRREFETTRKGMLPKRS